VKPYSKKSLSVLHGSDKKLRFSVSVQGKKTWVLKKAQSTGLLYKKNCLKSGLNPGFFKNPILVDFGDILLSFEGF